VWTNAVVVVLALGLLGQLTRDRTTFLAMCMYLPILPVGVVAIVQDLVGRGRSIPRIRFGLSMLGFAAVGWCMSMMCGLAAGGSPAADDIRLLHWNVMWGSMDNEVRWRAIVGDMIECRPDIIVLNEAPTREFLDKMLKRLGPEWSLVQLKNLQGTGYWFNLVVASRWPVEQVGAEPFKRGQTMQAAVKTPRGRLHVMVVDGVSEPKDPRMPRLLGTARIVARQATIHDPVDIIAGDLNTTSRSVGFERIADAAGGYRLASELSGWRGTWPSYLPLLDIDHVWVAKKHLIVSDEMLFNARLDHRGQMVRIRIGGG
jgi:endonuclease/exonuclease/phosphatase (EEP) superfamily protein YafD